MNFGPPSPIASKLSLELQQSLIEVAKRGDLKLLESLIELGMDLNAKDAEGMTAMHHAATNGQVKIMQLLVERGVDINDASSQTGKTALHYAVEKAYHIGKKFSPTVYFLMSNNANITVKFEQSSNLLNYRYHNILKSHLRNFWTLKLNAYSSDVKNKRPDKVQFHPGELEMMLLNFSENPIKGYETCIRNMIQLKVNLYALNSQGNTAMYFAARHGNVKLIRLFLKAGFPINHFVNQKMQTLLHAAIIGSNDIGANNVEAIQLLIKLGADLQWQDGIGKTPEAYLRYLDPIIEQQVSDAIQAGYVLRDIEKNFQVGKNLALIQRALHTESSLFPQEIFKNTPIPAVAIAYIFFMEVTKKQRAQTLEKIECQEDIACIQEIVPQPQQKISGWCHIQ